MRPARGIAEDDLRELERLLKTAPGKAQMQRIQCVLLRAREGMNARQVAGFVGWCEGWVRQVWSIFLRQGPRALISKGRGGRARSNLSLDRERALVERFEARARTGGMLVVSDIHAAYEREVGRAVAKSTIYRMLARHGWRKVAPRPCHPKNDPAVCESFKKNFRPSSRANAGARRRRGSASG